MNSIFPANKQWFLKIENTDVKARKFQGILGSDGQSMTILWLCEITDEGFQPWR